MDDLNDADIDHVEIDPPNDVRIYLDGEDIEYVYLTFDEVQSLYMQMLKNKKMENV